VIRNQDPGVTLRLGFFEDDGEPFQERLAVLVVAEELSSFDSPGHDVLEKAGGVKSGLAGHFFIRQYNRGRCQLLNLRKIFLYYFWLEEGGQ